MAFLDIFTTQSVDSGLFCRGEIQFQKKKEKEKEKKNKKCASH